MRSSAIYGKAAYISFVTLVGFLGTIAVTDQLGKLACPSDSFIQATRAPIFVIILWTFGSMILFALWSVVSWYEGQEILRRMRKRHFSVFDDWTERQTQWYRASIFITVLLSVAVLLLTAVMVMDRGCASGQGLYANNLFPQLRRSIAWREVQNIDVTCDSAGKDHGWDYVLEVPVRNQEPIILASHSTTLDHLPTDVQNIVDISNRNHIKFKADAVPEGCVPPKF